MTMTNFMMLHGGTHGLTAAIGIVALILIPCLLATKSGGQSAEMEFETE